MKWYAVFRYKLNDTNIEKQVRTIEANDIQEAEYKIKDICYKENGYNLEIVELYII